MATNKSTALSTLVIGGPGTNNGAWNIILTYGGANNTPDVIDNLGDTDGTGRISAQDTYEVVGVLSGAPGIALGTIITIDEVDYSGSAPDVAVVTSVAATGAGVVLARATNYSTEATFFGGGNSRRVARTLFTELQSGVSYNPNGGGPGVPSWTALNAVNPATTVDLIGNTAGTGLALDVTIKVNDIFNLNTVTGAETRGFALNLALYDSASGDYYTIATLEPGDVFTSTQLNTTVIDPAGPTTADCTLVIRNTNGVAMNVDIEVAITI
jgi:hypothetical protein